MFKVKHTPGPWNLSTIPFEIRNTDSAAAIYGPFKNGGSPLIADVSRSAGDEQATANAKLMAASPELLTALLNVIKDFSYNGTIRESYRQEANDAIQKATL